MTSLPPLVPKRLRDTPDVVNAYNICLKLEKSLQLAVNKGDYVGNTQIYIRILGYLIHFPTAQGLKNIVEEIHSCAHDSALLDVGKMYYDHHIRAFRVNKGRIPTTPNDESPSLFDTIAEMTTHTLVEAPQSHTDAEKDVGVVLSFLEYSLMNTNQALIRDQYRCVVTKRFDYLSVQLNRELQERVISDPSARTEHSQCAHIFSESTYSNIRPGSEKCDYASTMWTVMQRFGYESLPAELNGPNVHRLQNVMTLTLEVHVQFDQLKIWFVATGKLNEYKLSAAAPWALRPYPEFVTFTTPDQDTLPVPSPTYLAIHAGCAKVAHLSGAAACINKFYRDLDDSKTLVTDGASASMLEHAIF